MALGVLVAGHAGTCCMNSSPFGLALHVQFAAALAFLASGIIRSKYVPVFILRTKVEMLQACSGAR